MPKRHSFELGQRVQLVPGPMDGRLPKGDYEIVRLLPNDAADREYQIRNALDGHQRVVRESQLRRGAAPPPG